MEPISVSGHDGDGDGEQAILDVHATQEARLEGLRAPAPLVVEGDDLAVKQLVGLVGGASGGEHLLLELPGYIAQLHRHRRFPSRLWWRASGPSRYGIHMM